MNNRLFVICATLVFCLGFISCSPKKEEIVWQKMEVTASAYNSVPAQTDDQPAVAAWGDTLNPGMKSIAVSRDLIAKGLDHNTKIKIEGLDGIFLVKDKMHSRWRKKIDIYMGTDIKKAQYWGIKKLSIWYALKKDKTPSGE